MSSCQQRCMYASVDDDDQRCGVWVSERGANVTRTTNRTVQTHSLATISLSPNWRYTRSKCNWSRGIGHDIRILFSTLGDKTHLHLMIRKDQASSHGRDIASTSRRAEALVIVLGRFTRSPDRHPSPYCKKSQSGSIIKKGCHAFVS